MLRDRSYDAMHGCCSVVAQAGHQQVEYAQEGGCNAKQLKNCQQTLAYTVLALTGWL